LLKTSLCNQPASFLWADGQGKSASESESVHLFSYSNLVLFQYYFDGAKKGSNADHREYIRLRIAKIFLGTAQPETLFSQIHPTPPHS
jgi:hypothetical protein